MHITFGHHWVLGQILNDSDNGGITRVLQGCACCSKSRVIELPGRWSMDDLGLTSVEKALRRRLADEAKTIMHT